MNVTKTNNEVVKLIFSNKNFRRVTKQLAIDLHESKENAREELLLELINHRLSKVDSGSIVKALETNDSKLNRNITFAYKDARRKHFKAIHAQQDNETSYSSNEYFQNTLPQPAEPRLPNFSKAEIDEFKEFASAIFPRQSTREFVLSYLKNPENTQDSYGLTDRQLYQKLLNIKRGLNKRRPLIATVLRSDDEMNKDEQLKILKHVVFLIESENYTDPIMHIYLDKVAQEDIVQDILGMPGYRKPALVIPNWGRPEHIKADEYNFINCVYEKVDELEESCGLTC